MLLYRHARSMYEVFTHKTKIQIRIDRLIGI